LKEREWIASHLRGEGTGLGGLNWETIFDICQREGVGPALYTAISRENRIDIPLEFKNNLKVVYLLNHFRNASFLNELRELLGLFKKENIPLILLKGAALLAAVYDDPAHRPMSDIDLLIREEDLERAHHLILKEGYQLIGVEYWPWWRKFGGERAYLGDVFRIDLHWRLEFLGLQPSSGDIFTRTRKATISGAEALILLPEELLLHLIHHMVYQHLYLRLIWLFDILKVTTTLKEEIDWERIYDMARELSLNHPLFFGLKEAKELLRAPIPEKLIKEEASPSFGWLSYFLKFRGETEMGGNLIKLLRLPGTKNKFIFLLGAIFPSITFLQIRYQTSRKIPAYIYSFLRPFLIVYKCLKELPLIF
jgi:hypothetical protein